MFNVKNREGLPPAVVEELDQMNAELKAFLLREHNEDGTHNFGTINADGIQATNNASSLNSTIGQIIDQSQASGQWWKTGPWKIDDPSAGNPNYAFIRPPKVNTGTYDNYAPTDIDTAFGYEIEPDAGDVTLTGLKALDGANVKRLLFFRNRDSGNSVTLKHLSASSLAPYQFDLPGSVDVVLAPGQSIWLYYDPARNGGKWTAAITGQKAGGITEDVATSGVISSGFFTNTIIKAASDTVTNSATLTADSELTFNVTAGLYIVEFGIWHETTSFSNFRWQFTVPTLDDVNLLQGSFVVYTTGGTVSPITAAASSTTTWPTTAGRIDGQPALNKKTPISGRFAMTVATSGSVTFKFAQGTAGAANSVIVRPGSYVAYKKLV
jgi:hypothetical protein